MSNKRKVAVYARVSTEHEAQLSALENQIDWYKPIFEQHPEWELVEIYVDEGVTGTSASMRPNFIRMIKDASKNNFDLILTREVSRFARNTIDTLNYTRQLKANGVEVFFYNDNIKTFDSDGELRLTIMSSLAQEESRKISERVKAGQKVSREKGVVYGNGNILGYERINGTLVINEEQAETVKMIFELYLNGKGVGKIRDELEKRNKLTSTGKSKWHTATILHILQNSTYCGILEYAKGKTEDFLTHKRAINHDLSSHFNVKGSYPEIISEEKFYEVQKILKERKANTSCSNFLIRGNKSVWSSKLICECGHSFSRHNFTHGGKDSYPTFQCYSQNNHGTAKSREKKGLDISETCTTPLISEWKLQMMATKIFNDYVKNTNEIVELTLNLLKKHINDTADDETVKKEIKVKENAIIKKQKYLENLIDMRCNEEITKEIFLQKKANTENEINIIETDVAKLKASIGANNLDYEKRLKKIKAILKQKMDFSSPTVSESLIDGLVEKIQVSHNSFDWYLFPYDTNKENDEAANFLEGNNRRYIKIAEFKITKEDAIAYRYSISTKNRVQKWNDLTVSVWI